MHFNLVIFQDLIAFLLRIYSKIFLPKTLLINLKTHTNELLIQFQKILEVKKLQLSNACGGRLLVLTCHKRRRGTTLIHMAM